MFLTPRMVSISDLEYTKGFVSQSSNHLVYDTRLYFILNNDRSSHPSETLPDP